MDSHLLKILVCPLCKGPLKHDREQHTLVCSAEKLAFPINDGVPIMLESAAQSLVPDPAPAQPPAPGADTSPPTE